jgi:ketosteroid isomerase-like protein
VDVAIEAFDAFAQRELPSLLRLAHPDIELVAPGTAALARGGASYRGHRGIFQYFRDVARFWDELEISPHEFEEVGDRVIVYGRLRARGQGGLIVDEPAHWVLEFRDGMIARACAHANRLKAMAAAADGSAEQPAAG